ncbi:MAG TPA: FxLYD domain-containing protein [Methylomirabilota bacterium]|nr:FxLYD domain-containing protein [Methylomirabilota bacterium]
MRARRWLAAALVCAALGSPAHAQTYTPQSGARLTVSFTTERVGSGRVIVYGDVRNGANTSCERVVVSVEGLDDTGRVISRGRAYVFGVVPSRGTSPFEVRMSSPGSEKRWRVEVESFQFVSSGN